MHEGDGGKGAANCEVGRWRSLTVNKDIERDTDTMGVGGGGGVKGRKGVDHYTILSLSLSPHTENYREKDRHWLE